MQALVATAAAYGHPTGSIVCKVIFPDGKQLVMLAHGKIGDLVREASEHLQVYKKGLWTGVCGVCGCDVGDARR
jgi:hypothetical protein